MPFGGGLLPNIRGGIPLFYGRFSETPPQRAFGELPPIRAFSELPPIRAFGELPLGW